MLHLRDAKQAMMSSAYDDDDFVINDGDDRRLGMALHSACSKWPCPSMTDIALLVTKTTVQVRDPVDNWLPVHRLCRRQPSLSVIQHVVEAWPECVKQWTSDAALTARLPIHLACQHGASLDVIQYLAQVDPRTLALKTAYRQFTALDYALEYYSNHERERLDDDEQRLQLKVIEWLQQQEHQQHQQPVSSSSLSSSFTGKSSLNSTLTMSTVTDSDRESPESSEFSTHQFLEDSRLQEQRPQPGTKTKAKKILSLPFRVKNNSKDKKKQQEKQDAVKQLQAACWEEPPCFAKISKLVQGSAYGVAAVLEARTDHGQYTLLHQVCWNAAGSVAALEKQQQHRGNTIHSDILKIMTCLIQAWPESVQQVTSAGYLPLHLLLSGCSARRAVKVAASGRQDLSSTSTRSDDNQAGLNGDRILVQLVKLLIDKYPAALQEPAKVDGFLPLHCATHCGAPLSVVQTLVQNLPRTLHMPVMMIAVVDTAAAAGTREDAKSLGPKPLALANRSIMGDMTKRPDVIAWLTTLVQEEQREQQKQQDLVHRQDPEPQRQPAAVATTVATRQRILQPQQENVQQQQQQQKSDHHTADVSAGDAIPKDLPCPSSLPAAAAASNPPLADNATLQPPPSEPVKAASLEDQPDSSIVQTESASLLQSATDSLSNATASPPTAATDETGPSSNTTESERQEEQEQHIRQQRASFTFLYRRSP